MKDKRVMNRCIHFVVKRKESLEFLSLLLEFGKFLEVFIWVCFGFYRFRIFMCPFYIFYVPPGSCCTNFLYYLMSCYTTDFVIRTKNNSMVHESKICGEILLSWLNEFVDI